MPLRWIILSLVFLAGVLNYVDRQVVAILKPVLQSEFSWSDRQFGHLGTAFQFAAAVSYLGVGWLIDRIGLRRGYTLGVSVWSLAAMAHAAATTVGQFVVARVVLAAAEAVHTPASMKAIAENFTAERRSLAVGIVNTASNIGAILAPLLVPVMAGALGWHAAFLITGGLGFAWLAGWWACSGKMPAPVEPAANAAARASWASMFGYRATWAIALAKMLTDLVWWFLLFWAPGFLMTSYGLNMRQAGPPLAVIYGLAAIGAFSGGILPTWLLARGRSLNFSRKFSMLLYALLIVPLPLAVNVASPWAAVLIIGVALFAHQGFSTNIFSLAVDQFPSQKVATVISIGALFGNLSGMAMIEFTGWVLDSYKTYLPMFVICGSVYLIALLVIHLLLPRLEVRAA